MLLRGSESREGVRVGCLKRVKSDNMTCLFHCLLSRFGFSTATISPLSSQDMSLSSQGQSLWVEGILGLLSLRAKGGDIRVF